MKLFLDPIQTNNYYYRKLLFNFISVPRLLRFGIKPTLNGTKFMYIFLTVDVVFFSIRSCKWRIWQVHGAFSQSCQREKLEERYKVSKM